MKKKNYNKLYFLKTTQSITSFNDWITHRPSHFLGSYSTDFWEMFVLELKHRGDK